MDTTGNSNYNHYQVVIIVDYDDGRLFPLTEEIPKCLLPIANRKILGYQLDMLQSCGATEIFITTPHEYQTQLSQFIAEDYQTNGNALGIEIIPVPDMLGSADALRAVSDRIRGDFIVVNSDLMSQINLGVLVDAHRLKTADVTMMLSSSPIEETIEMNKKIKGGGGGGGSKPATAAKPVKIDEEDQEYIGLCDDGRVMIKTPALEVDDDSHLTFGKPLIHKSGGGSGGKLRLRCDLLDTGVYCMSFWILEFLAKSKNISTIRTDLLPYLVQRQHQSAAYLHQHLPGLEHRKRGLQVLEPWLVQTRATNECYLLPSLAFSAPPIPPSTLLPSTSAIHPQTTTRSTVSEMETSCFLSPIVSNQQKTAVTSPSVPGDDSSTQQSTSQSYNQRVENGKGDEDLLRCFAVVIESPVEPSPYPVICQRVTNFSTFLSLNSFLPFATVPVQNAKATEVCKWFCPWTPYAGSQVSAADSNALMKKEQSLVGAGSELGDKVTLKSCTVGKHCTIGLKSKLNQCVIMQGVKIGDNCTIQNCIISDNAVIENGCSLKHCFIGANVRMKEGSAVKQETISSSTISE